MKAKTLSSVGVLVVAGQLLGCGGGRPEYPLGDGGVGTFSGAVVKGPVAFATVTAYRLDSSFGRGAVLGTAQADGQGHFALSLPPYSGHILFVASTGVYTEEAVGGSVRLDGNELRAVVHDYRPGVATGPVLITPISHWAAALAQFWTAHQSEPLGRAMDEAYQHLNSHFGAIDWRSVEPTDFNSVDAGVGQDDADRAGILLAALSQEALGMARRAAVTPAVGVSSLDLVNALADDLSADGYFDGVGVQGPIHLPLSQPVLPASAPASATQLDGQTVRGALAAALMAYLQNPLDGSGLTFRDVQGTLNELSSDSDARIFRQGGLPYDTTPPLLAFLSVPPLYTAGAQYTLGVLAADPGSGVATVSAQTGANAPVLGIPVLVGDAGVLPDGGCVFGPAGELPDAGCIPATLYQFPLNFPTPAHYAYTVFGVDKAGNSTQTNGTSLGFNITFDNSPPQISVESSTLVYWDERGMAFVADGGVPIVPAKYAVTSQEGSVLSGTHDVYKASTRLSWGLIDGGPTADQLNAQDPSTLNVPFVPYDIAYNANVDAPITTCTYSVTCMGSGCGTFTSPATGSLLLDPGATTSVRYLLPLTSDTLPGLAQITGPVTLAVSVTATDGAGNASTKAPDNVTFHVVGAPVTVIEDTAYPTAGDVHSTYQYSVAGGSYAFIFDGGFGQFTSDNLVHVVRFIAYNAAPDPVAVQFSGNIAANSYQIAETWTDSVGPMNCSLPEFAASCSLEFGTGSPDGQCEPTNGQYPCYGTANTKRLTEAAGSYTYACDTTQPPPNGTTIGLTQGTSPVGVSYFANPGPSGGETQLAPSPSNSPGWYLVPGATNGRPGAIAIYVGHSPRAPRSRALAWESLNGGPNHFEFQVEEYWTWYSLSPVCNDQTTDQYGNPVNNPYYFQEYTGFEHFQWLSSAVRTLNQTFTVMSSPIRSGTTASFGESLAQKAVTATASINQ